MPAKFWLGDIVNFKGDYNQRVEAKVVNLTYIGPGVNTFEYELELPNGAKVFKYENRLKTVPYKKRKNNW